MSVCSSNGSRRPNPFRPGSAGGDSKPSRGPPSSASSVTSITTASAAPPQPRRGAKGEIPSQSAGVKEDTPAQSPSQSARSQSARSLSQSVSSVVESSVTSDAGRSGSQKPSANADGSHHHRSYRKTLEQFDIHGEQKTRHSGHRHHAHHHGRKAHYHTRHIVTKGGADGAPVDAFGRPACLSTMEPNIASHIRETKKIFYGEEDKEEQRRGAAGALTHHQACADEHFTGDRGKKFLSNSPTSHSCLHEVLFNRTDSSSPVFDVNYQAMFQDCGGLTSLEIDKRKKAESKQCVHALHAGDLHDLVFRGDMDDAHHIDPQIRKMYANAAGVGKSIENGRKKSAQGMNETQVGDLIYNQSLKMNQFEAGHAATKETEKRAGKLSSEMFRP